MKQKMTALIVGNANYARGPLRNPANDATDMAAKLKSYGFDVVLATDATNLEMSKKLKEFKALLDESDVGLYFFAGHGIQIDGTNYLLAVDTDSSDETEAKHSSLPLQKIIDTMEKSDANTKIIILDACRNNPWERAWDRDASSRGLASVYAPKGTIIAYATSPGQTAKDGKGRNGAYTEALLQHIDTADCSIESMFKRVRNTVAAKTAGKQITWEHTSLSGEFYFNLSLGQKIKTYKQTSLADSLFVLDDTKPSHRVVRGLKTYNWYSQNDAVALLKPPAVKGMSSDNLFVVGRNLYQAACGGSNSAREFIGSFIDRTSGFPAEKRKAILDGMLFEVFFDPDAKLRDEIKGNLFNELFELQKFGTVASSFDFIAEALVASRGRFYVLPGKKHELSVTVATKKVKDAYEVEGVYVDGVNVLRSESDEADTDIKHYRSKGRLEEQLSQELVVPARFLKIAYTPPQAAKADKFTISVGWTVRKG